MRIDQYIGLNDWARKLVTRKVKVHDTGARTLPSGKVVKLDYWHRIPVARAEKIGRLKGAWNPHVADLHRYTFPNGRVFEEYVQEAPWSGGPCYFIALRDCRTGKPVRESLWTNEELAQA